MATRYQTDGRTYGVVSADAWAHGQGPTAAIAWFSTEAAARASIEHLSPREQREWCIEPALPRWGIFSWENGQPR